ncbi:MAG: helix-turn-helix domain-containing protein [Bacilli bacterium]
MDSEHKIIVLTNKIEPSDYNQKVIIPGTAFLLVIFQTDMLFSYDGESYFKIPSNSAILYKPGTLQAYRSGGTPVLNSFMYIDEKESFFTPYKIPFDTIIALSKEDAEKIVFDMDRLSYIVNTPYAESLVPKIPEYIDKIFKTLSICCLNLNRSLSSSSLRASFVNVRSLMYANPIEYTVRKMAAAIGFTETYFGIKYKEFFKITPRDDRKLKMVEVIKRYLEETDYSLDYIGDLCSIKSTAHLINLFKSVENITPHQYRKKYRSK